jgi:hypothetical protein
MSVSAACAMLLAVAGCDQKAATAPGAATAPPPAAETPFRLTASIQDIMLSEIDPSADTLWDSVQTITSEKGVEEKQPRTDEEWLAVRHSALVLMEATNLIVMEGRKVAPTGKAVADEGLPGILNTAEIQKAIDSDHATFIKMAHALEDAGRQALTAIDARDVQGLLAAGNAIDTACENCHLKYWYPKGGTPPSASTASP